MAFLTYVAAHWALMIVVTLVAVGLAAGAWFLKNWKLAVASIFLVAVGFAFQGAVQHGINLEIAKQVAAQTEVYKNRLATFQTIAASDALKAAADKKATDALETLSNQTPANARECFDINATRRVHAIR